MKHKRICLIFVWYFMLLEIKGTMGPRIHTPSPPLPDKATCERVRGWAAQDAEKASECWEVDICPLKNE